MTENPLQPDIQFKKDTIDEDEEREEGPMETVETVATVATIGNIYIISLEKKEPFVW